MQVSPPQLDALGAAKEVARFIALKLALGGECYCRCEAPDLKALTDALALCYQGGFWFSVGKALGLLTIFGTGVAVGAVAVTLCPWRRRAREPNRAEDQPVNRARAGPLVNLRDLALHRD